MSCQPSPCWFSTEEQVRFHYDRSRENTVHLMKDIVHNPDLSYEEQLDLLVRIAEGHKALSDFILTRIGVDPSRLGQSEDCPSEQHEYC